MKIEGKRVLVTGASGGIGRHLVMELGGKGATVMLADRPGDALSKLCEDMTRRKATVLMQGTDLLQPSAPGELAEHALRVMGGVDILVNLAGIMSFALFQDEDAASIERLWRVNVIAPLILTRSLLPHMLARGSGRVVNIGSVFGSIGFACFANYSANKFAMRGFSQALRRELHGTGVGVTYVAPRYTRTPLNAGTVSRMAEALKMNMDNPERVAQHIVHAIEKDQAEHYVGFPESLFVRINAVLPGLVDGAMRKQNTKMREYATAE
jgi:short-subunit dehydrogenase